MRPSMGAERQEVDVLIGCEESQEMCIAFRRQGCNAFSCDLKPCSGGHPEWHLQDDVFKVMQLRKWDLIILHPPCTYTAVCGNRWYWNSPLREKGALFCKRCWDEARSVCEQVVLEQPRTTMQRWIGKKTQVIHPWQHGHPETKETWLWSTGVPLISVTNDVYDEMMKLPKKERHKIWYASPGEKRGEIRSKTFPGIANAFAVQLSRLGPSLATKQAEKRQGVVQNTDNQLHSNISNTLSIKSDKFVDKIHHDLYY